MAQVLWKVRQGVFTAGLCLMLLLAGCEGGDDNDGQAAAALVGSYRGTIQDSVAGSGMLSLTVGTSGDTLTGTWATSFANTRNNNNSGSLSGSANGESVSIVLQPSVSTSCPFQATGVVSGTQIRGNYAAFNCSQSVTGTFTVTRQ